MHRDTGGRGAPSYVVSARRWRPQTFEDLIGQEHVSRTLMNALRSGKVAHAFLFTGLRGVGKTTAARILAKALNCEQGPTPTPCNVCVHCEEITAGRAVDVLEIDGASNTGVDDVRQIIENVRYQAATCRFKVYIIDEVHMLSNSAFNALLKTLEEPPAHVKFIFATTDPHKLPPTVQSRCQRYDFRRIPLRLVVDRLRQIVAAEKVEMSDRALFLLAREGEGSMRDAQSLLDQVLAYGGQKIADADVAATLGIAERGVIFDIGDALIDRDAARVLAAVDTVYNRGHDLRRLGRDVLEHVRNLAVAKATGAELLPDLPEEEREAIRAQAGRWNVDECDRAFRILLEADEAAARANNPKLVLEMALINLLTLPPLVPVDEMLRRIDEIEQRMRRSPSAPPSTPAATEPMKRRPAPRAAEPPVAESQERTPATEEPAAAAAPATGGAPQWTEFIGFVQREKPRLAHYLERCEVAAADNTRLELRVARGFYYDYLARADHLAELRDCARRHFGPQMMVRVAVSEPTNGGTVAEALPASNESRAAQTDAVLGNPIVQAAVQILGGEVQEVRQRRGRSREER